MCVVRAASLIYILAIVERDLDETAPFFLLFF